MTKKEALRIATQESQLLELGFTRTEAEALRRISMTLRRWYELECGDSNSYGSWAIERDDNGDGKPFMVRHHYAHGNGRDSTSRTPIADRERGAKKRLRKIIDARNDRMLMSGAAIDVTNPPLLRFYLQTDPRGAALRIIRPGDIPDGKDVESYYDRGLVVC